jgi:hypothetical protein
MDTIILVVSCAPLLVRVGWAVWNRRRPGGSSTDGPAFRRR